MKSFPAKLRRELVGGLLGKPVVMQTRSGSPLDFPDPARDERKLANPGGGMPKEGRGGTGPRSTLAIGVGAWSGGSQSFPDPARDERMLANPGGGMPREGREGTG